MTEIIKTIEATNASVVRGAKEVESVNATGKYVAQCLDRKSTRLNSSH